jgi:SpoU rRNA methylase family enzyme
MADGSGVIGERLERLRQKLLDLTTNNRMLSYRHPKTSCLRVADELPGHLFSTMMNGQTLVFEPVPEPTPRELEAYHRPPPDQVPRANEARDLRKPDAPTWAKRLGLDTSYDLPVETDSYERSERHADKSIQTLHYPDELDPRLRKIRAAGRTAIEESGANMLYFAFGFLEWKDQLTSKAHQAPLILLPVELDRQPTRRGQFQTRVKWNGEDLQANLSLVKKMEEFSIALPEFDEERPLERYFTEIAQAVRHKPDWVLRRYVTLGLFEFGKILLYLDLDPTRWPSHAPISNNPLVRRILASEELDGHDGNDGQAPDSDDVVAARRDLELELVDRADSSQCEALETALSGKNLVIEGPPGTGKSQTITNLIAAALSRGKSVLFVAEKLAALEVVKRRLRELGLGGFCLELHSHKTRKIEMIEDIAERVRAAANPRPPKDFETTLQRLKAKRSQLAEYIDIIASPAGSLNGLTVGDALMRAGQSRRRLGDHLEAIQRQDLGHGRAAAVTWAQLADAKGRLRHLADAAEPIVSGAPVTAHPWAGVSSEQVLPHDVHRVSELAADWAGTVEALLGVVGSPVWCSLPYREIKAPKRRSTSFSL